jgi:hypothetical protein
MIEEPDILSPQGRRRRDEIGRLAREAARRRRRTRRIVPAVAVSVVFLMVAVAMFRFRPISPAPQSPIARKETKAAPLPAPSPPADFGITVALIKTESGISDRLSVPAKPREWSNAGDDELLQSLADAGHPSGLLYTNGEAILLAR